MQTDASPKHAGLHVIALIEGIKGALALLAASGLEIAGPKPLQHLLQLLIARFQLDPAHGVAGWFSHALNPSGIHIAAGIAVIYGVLHLIEGWGLWREKVWACWLGCISASAYLPFDIYAFIQHRHWLEAVVVAINLLVVGVLARDLRARWKR